MANVKTFDKAIQKNPNVGFAIGTIIAEYDIKSAHTSACYFIFGKEKYDELMSFDKLTRNTKIGLMIRDDQTLYKKIDALILKWFNQFCQANDIVESNFISSTRDSLLLLNKKPLVTKFENGIVCFRNKDGEFTSYIRIGNKEVLFDGLSNNLRIKGVTEEYVEGNRAFRRLFCQLLNVVESSKTLTEAQTFKKLSAIRQRYVDSPDLSLYASVVDGNKYVYNVGGERILSDNILDDKNSELVRSDNWVNFFLPVIKVCLTLH